MTIYYVYDRASGDFAGSGVTEINDRRHSSTTVAPTPEQAEAVRRPRELKWESGAWTVRERTNMLTKTTVMAPVFGRTRKFVNGVTGMFKRFKKEK